MDGDSRDRCAVDVRVRDARRNLRSAGKREIAPAPRDRLRSRRRRDRHRTDRRAWCRSATASTHARCAHDDGLRALGSQRRRTIGCGRSRLRACHASSRLRPRRSGRLRQPRTLCGRGTRDRTGLRRDAGPRRLSPERLRAAGGALRTCRCDRERLDHADRDRPIGCRRSGRSARRGGALASGRPRRPLATTGRARSLPRDRRSGEPVPPDAADRRRRASGRVDAGPRGPGTPGGDREKPRELGIAASEPALAQAVAAEVDLEAFLRQGADPVPWGESLASLHALADRL